jgi:uncharacterized protein
MSITLDDLRRFAVVNSLFAPTTLARALRKMGFVQADPIRAPARAQDLILRHRVENYRAGDLERRYHKLGIEEDFFINYGFVTREVQALMHPRSDSGAKWLRSWSRAQKKRAELLLEFVRERGVVHPREVEDHFSHGTVENYWGGSSNATTRLLDEMHYQGLLRVVRRNAGIRVYAVHQHDASVVDSTQPDSPKIDKAVRDARIDTLIDVAVNIYAPLPAKSLAYVIRRLRLATPQWQSAINSALQRARQRLAHEGLDGPGTEWYWPSDQDPRRSEAAEMVRLLTPFDPVVWDRWRFEMLWGWSYRFEAYTPPRKRVRGYYALPLLWRDRVIGWGNLSVEDGELKSDLGYVDGHPPRERIFKRELEAELERVRFFLGLEAKAGSSRLLRARSE